MNPQISKLEAILARVKQRAEMPRQVFHAPVAQAQAPVVRAPVAPPPVPVPVPAPQVEIKVTETIPPNSDARAAIELESRTRVVETTMELDESDLVEAATTGEAPAVEIEIGEPDEQPPSSRRPKPMEEIAEAQKDEPPPPPPPESGKLVAAPASFDDDFTGVREASNLLPPLEADAPSIEVQHVEPPKPPPVHEMEADLAPPPPAESESRRISDVAPAPPTPVALASAPLEPEVTNASVPAAKAVQVDGAVTAFKPQSFGELIDATLGL